MRAHRFSAALPTALQMPARKPGRTLLTTLGLAIGVGAFIAMVNFGRGARSSVVAQFETLGSNLLRVKTEYAQSGESPQPLTDADVQALRRQSTSLAYVVPHLLGAYDLAAGGKRVRTGVIGATPEIADTEDWAVSEGGMYDALDEAERAKVCVLGKTTARALFGERDPLGEIVTVDGKLPCRVIGVLAPHGSSISGSDMDDRLMLPLRTFEAQLGQPFGYWTIEVRPQSRALIDSAKLEISEILRRTHHIEPGGNDDFRVLSPDDITRVAQQVGGTLTALLAAIAAVSLLVGGIGIMNIQLVSVAERTHEIGVRAAIGASPEQIMRQFLSEAVALAALGSALGVAVGVGASLLVQKQMHWPLGSSPDVVLGSALFGIAVGTLFGYLPAKRAADLDPIEALRRE